MGYSIAVKVEDRALQEEMWNFLVAHYKEPKDLYNLPHNRSDLVQDGDFAYNKVKGCIGFNYNSPDPERTYIFSLCSWMAIRVGRKRSRFKEFSRIGYESENPLPYLIYDGGDVYPIIPSGTVVPDSLEWCLHDDDGFQVYPTNMESFDHIPTLVRWTFRGAMKEIRAWNRQIKGELKRLSDLWSQR